MGQQRERAVARRKSKLKGRDQDRATRRARLERILGVMGLKDWFRHLRTDAVDFLCRGFNPKPLVVPDPNRPGDLDLTTRARDLQRKLDRVAIKVGSEELSFNDYFSIVLMMFGMYRSDEADRSRGDILAEPMASVEEFVGRHDMPIREAYQVHARAALCESSGIDTAIYTAFQGFVQKGDRIAFTTTLRRTQAHSRTIEAEGVGRRAYRCGGFYDLESGEVDWAEWDAMALGLAIPGHLPVFIQSHAMHQTRLRLGLKPDYLVNYSTWRSLAEPVLTPIAGGTYLVEYRLLGHKLGYLVAKPVGDAVLVRSFLLVTMQGTPEGSEFSRRLRLRRPDIEYLELDRLGTLTSTDLSRDPEIAGLLRACGCGDALDLASKLVGDSIAEGYATRFRDYAGPALRNSPPANYSRSTSNGGRRSTS